MRLSISSNTLLGKLVRFPLRMLPPSMILRIMLGRARGKQWIVGSGNHGCWLGSYERGKRLRFQDEVEAGSVVFDVGAHVGFYTILASVLVGEAGKVIAFEPVARNLLYLREHIRRNQLTNVRLIEAAVAESCGEETFDQGPNSFMGRLSPDGVFKVRTVSLDVLVATEEIPFPRYIKMDIEGGEFGALSGARMILERVHPTIFLATHGSEVHRRCCLLLESLGYQLAALDGSDVKTSRELIAQYRPVRRVGC